MDNADVFCSFPPFLWKTLWKTPYLSPTGGGKLGSRVEKCGENLRGSAYFGLGENVECEACVNFGKLWPWERSQ